jgi:hypothetical protein
VIDLSSSSDEEDLITITSCDFEFAQKLFGELNRAILGPPGDGKIIVLSDSDKEVREEKTSDTKTMVASTAVNPASIASASIDDAPVGVKNDNSDDQGPDQEADGDNDSGDDADEP